MGCSQSKDEQVVEPTTAPASECGNTKLEAAALTENVAVDQSSASQPSPKPRASAASTTLEDDVRASEQPAAESMAVEDKTEAAGVEAPAAEAPVAEAPVAEAPVAEAPVAEAPVAEAPVAEAPVVVEPVVEEPVVEEAVVHEPVAEEPVTEEPVAEEPPAEAADTDKSAVADTLTFTVDKVTFTAGVAFYNMTGVSAQEPSTAVHVSKRFSEFRALHAEMAKLMPSKTSTDEDTPVLPAMPSTSFLQARADKAMLEEREAAFVAMLNAIARHPEAAQSEAFTAFCV